MMMICSSPKKLGLRVVEVYQRAKLPLSPLAYTGLAVATWSILSSATLLSVTTEFSIHTVTTLVEN